MYRRVGSFVRNFTIEVLKKKLFLTPQTPKKKKKNSSSMMLKLKNFFSNLESCCNFLITFFLSRGPGGCGLLSFLFSLFSLSLSTLTLTFILLSPPQNTSWLSFLVSFLSSFFYFSISIFASLLSFSISPGKPIGIEIVSMVSVVVVGIDFGYVFGGCGFGGYDG